MRAISLSAALVLGTLAGPVSAQATAAFPAPPAAPAGASGFTAAPHAAHPGWGGAALTAAPVAPVAPTGWSWEPEPRPLPMQPLPDADRAPPGYQVEEHTPATPIVVGSLLVGVPYATGLGIAAAEGFANSSGWLAVPVLGPWLALGARDNPCDGARDAQEFNSDVGHCVAEPFVRGMLVLDGVLQATGSVVLIAGASASEKRVVPKRSARVVAMPQPVGRSGYGVGVVGSFF